MNKSAAIKLRQKAFEVAENFSNGDRALNMNKEIFKVERIVPFSDCTAAVIFSKNSGKKAIAFFYYFPPKDDWKYFFPNDSHLVGMAEFPRLKTEIEKENFEKNFL
jgi:hypothetical protein